MATLKSTKIKTELLKRHDLKYVHNDKIVIKRLKRGKGFTYKNAAGETITDQREKERLKNIAVPPTYNDVFYCELPNGHIQAMGKDSKGKIQYFYHTDWAHLREITKFSFMHEFGLTLPRFRRKINSYLKNTDLDNETILAAMGRILDRTGMRIGGEQSTKINNTYGLTTLKKGHLSIEDNNMEFTYKGKGGHDIDRYLTDSKISEVIDQCVEIPGQRLFEYEDKKGQKRKIESTDLNKFIKDIMGSEFTAKDFRTWRFSCLFLEIALDLQNDSNLTLKSVLDTVSEETGNTPAILKSSYIHPGLIKIVKDGAWEKIEIPSKQIAGLRKIENIFFQYLKSEHSEKSLLKKP